MIVLYNTEIDGLKQMIEEETIVLAFLADLQNILTHYLFDPKADLILQLDSGERDFDNPNTTKNTMAALDYNVSDIAEKLGELSIQDYVESKIKHGYSGDRLQHVFCKVVNEKEINIKIGFVSRTNEKVLCYSFHFAERPLLNKRVYQNKQ